MKKNKKTKKQKTFFLWVDHERNPLFDVFLMSYRFFKDILL